MLTVRYPGLNEYIIEQLQMGVAASEMWEYVKNNFNYEGHKKTFSNKVSKMKKKLNEGSPQPAQTSYSYNEIQKGIPEKSEDDFNYLNEETEFINIVTQSKNINIYDLCDKLSCPPKRVKELVEHFRSKGSEIVLRSDQIILSDDIIINDDITPIPQLGETEIIFGVASDLHFGSHACQITALNQFAHICKKEGVKHIFVPGDVFSGIKVYPGHEYDIYAQSAEEQEASLIKNLPTGFDWFALGGNHDYSFIKKGGGHNALKKVESEREDFHYLGFDDTTIPILNGVDLRMWHPSGGVPYSVSYRLQKGVEQIAYAELSNIIAGIKEKPTVRFLLAGHLHIQMQAMFGSIFGAQCGTFEGQTNYLKRKGLVPNIGGYIIKASLNTKGKLSKFEAPFYMFEEIEHDWKSYSHSYEMKKEFEKGIFEK